MKNTYQIIEDNGGNLYMFVWDNNNTIIFASIISPKDIQACIADIDNATAWDEDAAAIDSYGDRQAYYDSFDNYETGWAVIADEDGAYPEKMGCAGQEAFGIENL